MRVNKEKKLKSKKMFIMILILTIIALIITAISLNLFKVFASEEIIMNTEWNRYFYNQLTPNAKGIYDSMYEMYSKGIFKKGESMEITAKISESSMALAVNGNDQLLKDYGAARDAFQNDHPDCFYVDWDELSIRVTQDKSGKLHAFLGAGRSDSYLLAGMSEKRCNTANGGYGTGIEGAIKQYNDTLNKVVDSIRNNGKLTDGEGKELSEIDGKTEGHFSSDVQETIRMVGEAHDYVVKNMVYRHEEDLVAPDRLCPLYGSPDHKDEHSTCRTAYDGLIYKTGVCEAYTRTFKAILDRLGIPCICVTGIYSPKSTINEPHIWNYVQIDGKWYGVDVTHDDPTNSRWWYQRNSTHETREFWLVGEGTLASHHFPQGIISSANYEFTYPTLSRDSLRETYVYIDPESKGIKVEFDKDYQFDDQTDDAFESSTVYISYNGKNYTQNAEEGKYIIVKTYMYYPGTDEWQTSDWWYIDPWYIAYDDTTKFNYIESKTPRHGSEEEGNAEYFTKLEFPQVRKLEVAVTDVPPGFASSKKEFQDPSFPINNKDSEKYISWETRHHELMLQGAAYFGEAEDTLTIRTGVIDNKYGNYVKPPMCINLSPGGTLYAEDWYTIVMKFDENLKLKDGCSESDINIKMTTSGGAGISVDNAGATAGEYAVLEDIKWNGKDEVSFRFRASQMWADDHTYYTFQVENLIGTKSLKQPLPESIGMTFRRYCSAYKAQGYGRNVYGQPQLMDSNTVDLSSWNMKDNLTGDEKEITFKDYFDDYMNNYMDEQSKNYGNDETFMNALRERLTLVTAETSPNQKAQMEDAIEHQFGEQNIVSGTVNTYNISITVCQMQVLKTGQGVRIALGFPDGTTYEDFAKDGKLSFKAYHYIVDPETDKLTGEVEEIPVTVTRQGLVLLVKSFSPFTVAAVNNTSTDTTKTLVTASSKGGEIKLSGTKLEGYNANITFSEKENEKVFEIVPEEGYEIDSIFIDGVRQPISEKDKAQNITVKYNEITTGAVLEASFVDSSIHKEEEKKGLSSDFTFEVFNVSLDKSTYEFVEGDNVKIEPIVNVTGGDFTPVNLNKDFDPVNDIKPDYHPDYIKYEWCDNGSRDSSGSPFSPNSNHKNRVMTFNNITTAENGYQRILYIKPMRWNGTEYEVLKKDENEISANSGTFRIIVYKPIKLKVLDENNLDIESPLKIMVGEKYKLNSKTYREKDGGEEVVSKNVTWESSNSEYVSVSKSGEITVNRYSNVPVMITAKITDINGEERKQEVIVNTTHIVPNSITLDKTKLELEVGENDTLGVSFDPVTTTDKQITWSVEEGKDNFVTVEDGFVTAKSLNNGEEVTVKVIAITNNEKKAECLVTVKKTYATSIIDDTTSNEIDLVKGSTLKMDVSVLPVNTTDKTITWEVTPNDKVTVIQNSDGKYEVTASDDALGTYTLKAIANGSKDKIISKEYTINIVEEPHNVTDVKLIPSEKQTIKIGEGIDFNVNISSDDPDGKATYQEIKWSVSSGDGIVSIDSEGYVTGLKVGTATIQVQVICSEGHTNHTATAEVEVLPIDVEKVEVNPTSLELTIGDSQKLEATITPLNSTDSNEIKWSSKDSNIASVDNDGNVKAVSKGNTTITVTVGEKTATCEVSVKPLDVEELVIDSELKLKDNEEKTLTVSYLPLDAEYDSSKIRWKSENEEIASVENGVVKPHKVGETDIKVYVDGKEDTIYGVCHVTVVASSTDLVVYTVDQNNKFVDGITLKLLKIENNRELLIDEIKARGKAIFKGLTDGTYILEESEIPDDINIQARSSITNIIGAYEFTVVDGKIYFENENNTISSLSSMVIVNTTDNSEARVQNGSDYPNIEEEYKEFEKTLVEETPGGNTGNQGEGEEKPEEGSTGDVDKKPEEIPSGETDKKPEESQNNKPDSNNKNPLPPNTSDMAIGLFITLMIVSFIGIVFIIYKKKHQNFKR